MASVSVQLYDAFSEIPFGGNVAGVVLDASTLSERVMQSIASEIAAPTTGFVIEKPENTELRFFTPEQEIDMCGHVVVGVTNALLDSGRIGAASGVYAITFRTAAGPIPVELRRDANGRTSVMMTQKLPQFSEPRVDRTFLANLLGLPVSDLHPIHPIEIGSTALRHLIVPVSALDVLQRLKPDNRALATLSKDLGVETIPVVALNPRSGVSARSRDLCPGIGNSEESASGTTNGALSCWLIRHGLVDLPNSEVVHIENEQGVEMGRPSNISCEISLDDGAVTQVKVGGAAIRSLDGKLFMP